MFNLQYINDYKVKTITIYFIAYILLRNSKITIEETPVYNFYFMIYCYFVV